MPAPAARGDLLSNIHTPAIFFMLTSTITPRHDLTTTRRRHLLPPSPPSLQQHPSTTTPTTPATLSPPRELDRPRVRSVQPSHTLRSAYCPRGRPQTLASSRCSSSHFLVPGRHYDDDDDAPPPLAHNLLPILAIIDLSSSSSSSSSPSLYYYDNYIPCCCSSSIYARAGRPYPTIPVRRKHAVPNRTRHSRPASRVGSRAAPRRVSNVECRAHAVVPSSPSSLQHPASD